MWEREESSMRVNIYAQELLNKLEVTSATAANTGASFRGIRFYLKSHEDLVPPKHPDDDSSAVTFWVPSGKNGYQAGDELLLVYLFKEAARLLEREALRDHEKHHSPHTYPDCCHADEDNDSGRGRAG